MGRPGKTSSEVHQSPCVQHQKWQGRGTSPQQSPKEQFLSDSDGWVLDVGTYLLVISVRGIHHLFFFPTLGTFKFSATVIEHLSFQRFQSQTPELFAAVGSYLELGV